MKHTTQVFDFTSESMADWEVARMRGNRVRLRNVKTGKFSNWIGKEALIEFGLRELFDAFVKALPNVSEAIDKITETVANFDVDSYTTKGHLSEDENGVYLFTNDGRKMYVDGDLDNYTKADLHDILDVFGEHYTTKDTKSILTMLVRSNVEVRR